jgi:serine/threonine-protein kinase
MSTVYEAIHRNGRRVAIKILHPELSLDVRARQRFLREGYIANRVGHTGAVAILDDGVADDGTVFLVLELLQGQTLGDRLRRIGPLPPGEVIACVDRVLDILASAHERGIVHRDVKPENLFLTRERQLKLLDFGIASVRELSVAGVEPTGIGATLGTPAFMAPEQAMGSRDPVDHRADLWALGATMLTLLTGRHVDGAGKGSLGALGESPSVGDVAPYLDAGLAQVIDVALQRDRSRRWADARSMRHALRHCAAASSFELPLPSPPLSSASADETGSLTLTHSTDAPQTAGSAASAVHSPSKRAVSVGIATALLAGALLLSAVRTPQSGTGAARVAQSKGISDAISARPVALPISNPPPETMPATQAMTSAARTVPVRHGARRNHTDKQHEVVEAPRPSLTSDETLDQRR